MQRYLLPTLGVLLVLNKVLTEEFRLEDPGVKFLMVVNLLFGVGVRNIEKVRLAIGGVKIRPGEKALKELFKLWFKSFFGFFNLAPCLSIR